jgi:hypothetical protein
MRGDGLCQACHARHYGRARVGRRGYHNDTHAPPPQALPAGCGYDLLTLRDCEGEARERARRVEVYLRMLEEAGRIDYAACPPPPDAGRAEQEGGCPWR